MLVRADGEIALVNERVCELFGYRREELLGRPVELLVPERLRDLHVADRADYHARPRVRPIHAGLDLVGRRKDGSELPLEISLSPIEEDGELLVIAFIRDISVRRRAEQDRLEFNRVQAVEQLVSSLDAIVWETTTLDRRRHSYVGGRGIGMLGYPLELWTEDEHFWRSRLHDDDRELTTLELVSNARHRDTFALEYRLVAADGRIVFVRDVISVVRSADGEPVELRGVLYDITDRFELESRLAHAQKMEAVGQLAGGIAHDFNNLLTVISGYTSRLLKRSEDEQSRFELNEMTGTVERAVALTRQLLTLTRRRPHSAQRVDLSAELGRMAQMLDRLLGEHIRIELALADGLPAAAIDSGRLEQIVLNLAVNARDAMQLTGGVLELRSGSLELDQAQAAARQVAPGRYVILTVRDSGEGIAPQIRERIFEPFFTTKSADVGTGLGLATVHGIVSERGGFIDVESEPGTGTCFRVCLPAAQAGADAAAPVGETPQLPTILLVEDDEALRRLATTVLEEAGYVVLEAATGREALTVAEHHQGRLDLLLTDVVMPELSGPQLARHLSALRPEIQILYMSGYTDSRLAYRGVDQSQVELVTKPFAPADLVARVQSLIGTESGHLSG